MKLNKKGFAVTGILYTLLVIFLVLMLGLLTVFSNRKNILNKLKSGIVDNSYLSTVYTYSYNQETPYYTFTAPVDGTYRIELWGAQGGSIYGTGGLGAYTKGDITLKKGEKLYSYLGSQPVELEAGANGGGGGGNNETWSLRFSGGGGATDIRLVNGTWDNSQSLNSRIMVAGGGGGGNNYYVPFAGGEAGGLQGGNSNTNNWNSSIVNTGANGGTQTQSGLRGGFGKGGNYCGGGGYYGGGATAYVTNQVYSGSGGSSFISGHEGCDAITEESTSTNIVHTGMPNHYSGYIFTNTVMIDGAGYVWTTEKAGTSSGMPTHDGNSTMTGNTGDGYAKITVISVN